MKDIKLNKVIAGPFGTWAIGTFQTVEDGFADALVSAEAAVIVVADAVEAIVDDLAKEIKEIPEEFETATKKVKEKAIKRKG